MKKSGGVISNLFKTSVISLIAAAMAAMLGMVIDGAIIGRFLGTDCMASYGLIMPVLNLATAFAGVLALGSQVVCAQRLGAGDVKGARRAFSMTMVITVVLSAVMILVFLIFRDDICVLLGARGNSAHLLRHTSDYLLGLLPAFPCVLMLLEFNSLMRLDSDANRVIVAVSVMTGLDIIGDLLNAFVIKGGMLGMGLTTSISYFVALVILLFHFTKKDIVFRFSFKGLRLRDLGAILGTGSSSAMGSTSAMLRIGIINQILVATALSSVAVAAFGIVNSLISFISGLMVGVGMTCAMIAGMILGEQDRSAAETLVKVTVKTVLMVSSALAVVLIAGADIIAGLFKGDGGDEAARLAARGLRFYAVASLLYGINNAFVNYTQGMRRMVLSNVYCFLQNFVFIVVPALILSKVFKGENETDCVWVSFIICETLTFLCIVALAAFMKKGFPNKWKDFLFLREGFGVPEEDLFEISISEEEQVIPASKAVAEFCERSGANDREKMLIPLCVEELAENAVKHGFKDGKKHGIDIRVIRMSDGWIMRFRDNGALFDPTDWMKLHESDDPDANIGIRMVCGMAKDVQYLSTLELNNVTIRF